MGRPRKNLQANGWEKKLYSVFFPLAELNWEFEIRWADMQESWKQEKDAAARAGSTDRQNELAARVERETKELSAWQDEQLLEIDRRFRPIPYNPIAYKYLTLDPPISEAEGIREYLHFHRHGESLQATETKDLQGNLNAWDKISRTERDIRILAHGKGPITPFQEHVVHRQLLELVISFERERLTAEELTECFDKYCACRNREKTHDMDSLRKMRDRLEAELTA
jgi:hypothetical protein